MKFVCYPQIVDHYGTTWSTVPTARSGSCPTGAHQHKMYGQHNQPMNFCLSARHRSELHLTSRLRAPEAGKILTAALPFRCNRALPWTVKATSAPD